MNEQWKAYAEADQKKRAAELALKEAKAVMEELEPMLLDAMAEEGIDRISINGVTYYPTRRMYVGPDTEAGFDKIAVASVLKAVGLGTFVKSDYNTNSLSAYIRELADENGGRDKLSTQQMRDLLPRELAAVLKVGDTWSIGSRKG